MSSLRLLDHFEVRRPECRKRKARYFYKIISSFSYIQCMCERVYACVYICIYARVHPRMIRQRTRFEMNSTDVEVYKECNYCEEISLLDFFQEQDGDPRESSPSFLSVIRAESFRVIVQTRLLQSKTVSSRSPAHFRFAVSIKHRQQFRPADFPPRYKPVRSAGSN